MCLTEVSAGGNDPIGPAIIAKVPDEAQDSSDDNGTAVPSERFDVAWGAGAPAAGERPKPLTYAWTWRVHEDYKATAKRVPESFFDKPDKQKPIVPKPQWYAQKGSQWLEGKAPNNGVGDSIESTYQVRCCVTFDDGSASQTPWADWNVYVYKVTPSVSPPYFNTTTGKFNGPLEIPSVTKTGGGSNYTATVSGMGNFGRTVHQLNVNGMHISNGFYNKIVEVHEGEHVNQWGTQDPWNGLYDAGALWPVLNVMTATGGNSVDYWLESALRERIDAQRIQDDLIKSSTSNRRERLAHGLSNAVNPPYLRQDLNSFPDPAP